MKKKRFAMLKLTEVKACGMILSTYQSLPHSPTYLPIYILIMDTPIYGNHFLCVLFNPHKSHIW